MDELHELTAAYALDALDADEERAYEAHLAGCERCQDELASLSSTATALAYAAGEVAPPEALRGRILEAARAERTNVVPLRPRERRPWLANAAAIPPGPVVGLGVWNGTLQHRLHNRNTPPARPRRPAPRRRIRKLRLAVFFLVLSILALTSFTAGVLTAVRGEAARCDPTRRHPQVNGMIFAGDGHTELAILRGRENRTIIPSERIAPV